MNKDLINDNIDLSQEIMKLCVTKDTLTQNYTMVNILFGVLLANFVEIYNLDAEIFTFDLYGFVADTLYSKHVCVYVGCNKSNPILYPQNLSLLIATYPLFMTIINS